MRVGVTAFTVGADLRLVLLDPHRHGGTQPVAGRFAAIGIALMGGVLAFTDCGSVDPFHMPWVL
jgi:hypothetical protein